MTSLEPRVLMSCTSDLEAEILPALDPSIVQGLTAQQTSTNSTVAAASTLSVPAYNSRPGAYAQIYLDFDGDGVETWGSYTTTVTPAYSTDGDTTTYSTSELSSIQEIWSRVAEKYSPFNINVTTADPGDLAVKHAVKVVIGGAGAWLGQMAGGVAYVNAFNTSYLPRIAWVFEDNLGNGYAKYVAEAAAHEAGHTFGLYHQSEYSGTTLVNSYYAGTSSTAPTMGNSYTATRGLWWNGTSTSSTTYQDDMSIIASSTNGFGYAADDCGNVISAAGALSMSGNSFSTTGVIGKTTDVDCYRFTTGGGTVSINGAVATKGATLNLKLQLLNSAGTVISTADTASLGESLSATLSAGTYYIMVSSHGSYGDVGSYTLSGTAPASYALNTASLAPIVGGDFNGDGKTDILWRDASNGALTVWLMNGLNVTGSYTLAGSVDTNWSLVGVGDLTGDGIADILWRHNTSGQIVSWLMNNNGTVYGYRYYSTVTDTNWQIFGLADLDGNGTADFLWKHVPTGVSYVWLLGANSANFSSQYMATVDFNSWRYAGAGDMNQDGKQDLVWRHASGSATYAWIMNQGTISNVIAIANTTDNSWLMAGIGDFNGDGIPDLFWSHAGDGTPAAWLLSGPTTYASANYISA